MATRNVEHEIRRRDTPAAGADKFARESFTWRRMKPYQIWASVIAAALLIGFGLMALY